MVLRNSASIRRGQATPLILSALGLFSGLFLLSAPPGDGGATRTMVPAASSVVYVPASVHAGGAISAR